MTRAGRLAAGPRPCLSPQIDAVFAALADPTRRAVVERLAAARLGDRDASSRPTLPVTPPGGRQAPRALGAADLVSSRRAGRETRYTFTPEPFAEAMSWMATAGARWDDRLAALERHAQCELITRSTRPYSTASSGLKKRSRSMSAWTCSTGCPVCLA